jgi:8-oxo-dGTP diphosphatase
VERPPGIFVGAGVLVHRQGKLLLVKRTKEPGKGTWSFPGGAVELGETTVEAALREVKEETGLDIEIESLFDVVTYLPGERGTGSKNQVIVVDYLAKPKKGRVRLNAESSDFGWFTPKQVSTLRTIVGVQRCADKFVRMGLP